MSTQEKSSSSKYFKWLIALGVVILFAVTSPKSLDAYGKSDRDRKYYKVDNYLLFSTLSGSYQSGAVWKVVEVGILGMHFKVKDY